MKGGAVLLAILLGIFLAVGQCGSGASGADKDYSNSSTSNDDSKDHGDAKDDGDASKDHEDSDKDSDKDSDDGSDEHDSDGDSQKDSPNTEAMAARLHEEGLHVEDSATSSGGDCAAHSYGEVSGYFADHRCRSIERAWYLVGDGEGNRAIVSAAWVEMPDPEDATDLQRLVDRPGTGNITELSKDKGPHQDVTYSGAHYDSGRNGDTFHSVQAEPLDDSEGAAGVARRSVQASAADDA